MILTVPPVPQTWIFWNFVWFQQPVEQQTDCYPHPGLGGEPPGAHPRPQQEHAWMSLGVRTGMLRPQKKVHKGRIILWAYCLFFVHDCESSYELYNRNVSSIKTLNVLFLFTIIIFSSGPSELLEEFLLTLIAISGKMKQKDSRDNQTDGSFRLMQSWHTAHGTSQRIRTRFSRVWFQRDSWKYVEQL